MTENVRTFNLERPVVSVSKANYDDFYGRIADSGNYNPKNIARVLVPLNKLRSTVIRHEELSELQRRLKINADEFHNAELEAYIQERLESMGSEISIARQPAVIPITTKRSLLVMRASSRLIYQRNLAKECIPNFYRLHTMPIGIWLPDNLVTNIRIGSSDNNLERRDIVQSAFQVLTNNPEIISAPISLGEIGATY